MRVTKKKSVSMKQNVEVNINLAGHTGSSKKKRRNKKREQQQHVNPLQRPLAPMGNVSYQTVLQAPPPVNYQPVIPPLEQHSTMMPFGIASRINEQVQRSHFQHSIENEQKHLTLSHPSLKSLIESKAKEYSESFGNTDSHKSLDSELFETPFKTPMEKTAFKQNPIYDHDHDVSSISSLGSSIKMNPLTPALLNAKDNIASVSTAPTVPVLHPKSDKGEGSGIHDNDTEKIDNTPHKKTIYDDIEGFKHSLVKRKAQLFDETITGNQRQKNIKELKGYALRLAEKLGDDELKQSIVNTRRINVRKLIDDLEKKIAKSTG